MEIIKKENPTLPESSRQTEVQVYSPELPLLAQLPSRNTIAVRLVALWIELERIVVKAPEIDGRTSSEEEIKLMEAMISRYATLTPKEIGDSMRRAAKKAQEAAAAGQFPRLYLEDIEREVQKTVKEREKQDAAKEVLQLPANTGGNVFWGEPSEALAREWPNIVRNTKSIRETLNRNYLRDRFWYGGNKEQQAAAKQMLIQMVHDMTSAGFCTIDDLKKEAVGVFSSEFARAFTQHLDLVEHLACPLDFLQIDEIKKRLSRRVADVSEFPDIDDCKYSATFDLYFKFKNEK